jgi:hypothetical protein
MIGPGEQPARTTARPRLMAHRIRWNTRAIPREAAKNLKPMWTQWIIT